MFDIQTYRFSETLAKTSVPFWQMASAHSLDFFHSSSFPVRVESMAQLAQFGDTMQEGRFQSYMTELGGMTEAEFEAFVGALADYVDFYQQGFQTREVPVPYSAMISAFAIHDKIMRIHPRATRILEIGPGCGYVSFFMARDKRVAEYTQIEACESFYLLQNKVNQFLYGRRFAEHAITTGGLRYPMSNHWDDVTKSRRSVIRDLPATCHHYPWWLIGDILDRPDDAKFDVVTSNANLTEFSEKALWDYVALARKALKPDGLIYVNCIGGGGIEAWTRAFQALYSSGFVAAFATHGHNESQLALPEGTVSQYHVTQNLVFVAPGHPLYERTSKTWKWEWGYFSDEELCRALISNGEGRRAYSEDAVLDRLRQTLDTRR
ncbi:MAG: class I SAM-dependent methyltransferase [Alphaproteobacteria bacterium]|nr:class I SAM-dependent methyltransferase [Alphaproteobacteria bacterium]